MNLGSPSTIYYLLSTILFGAHGAGEIPVLIPNTEVKPSSGDYTATSGKLARCRIIKRPSEQGGLFLLILILVMLS